VPGDYARDRRVDDDHAPDDRDSGRAPDRPDDRGRDRRP
jgi:hypothetical protein